MEREDKLLEEVKELLEGLEDGGAVHTKAKDQNNFNEFFDGETLLSRGHMSTGEDGTIYFYQYFTNYKILTHTIKDSKIVDSYYGFCRSSENVLEDAIDKLQTLFQLMKERTGYLESTPYPSKRRG